MKPIEDIKDIKILVDHFYAKIQEHPNLGPIFNQIAAVSWDSHLEKMYLFWNTVLFSQPGYKGSPTEVHLKLSRKAYMPQALFDEWVSLFCQTVDEHFEGEIADLAKSRAKIIAWSMSSKVNPIDLDETERTG